MARSNSVCIVQAIHYSKSDKFSHITGVYRDLENALLAGLTIAMAEMDEQKEQAQIQFSTDSGGVYYVPVVSGEEEDCVAAVQYAVDASRVRGKYASHWEIRVASRRYAGRDAEIYAAVSLYPVL